MLLEELGRAGDLAQPGGFRRHHLQQRRPSMDQQSLCLTWSHLFNQWVYHGLSEERCNPCNLEICTRGWKFLRAKCQGMKFVYIGGRYQNCHLHYTGRRKPFTWLEFQVEPLAGPSCSEIFRSRAAKRQAGRGDWSIGDCRCRWLLQFWHCLADIDTCDFKAKLSDLGCSSHDTA